MITKKRVIIAIGVASIMLAGLAIACDHTSPTRVLTNREKAAMYGASCPDRCYLLTLCSDVPCGNPPCGTRYWKESCAHCGYSTDPDKPECDAGDSEGCGSERNCVQKGGNCEESGPTSDCQTVTECD